jgi:hypothetical protein
MNETELRNGLSSLNTLAQEEYKESLEQIIGNEAEDEQLRIDRIGRLIGVILKMPFASPSSLESPSYHTRAYRAWNLVGEASFYSPERQRTPQYQTLEAILEELKRRGIESQDTSVYQLAQFAQFERGFFGYLAIVCREYICKDPELRKKVDEAMKEAKTAGVDLKYMAPEVMVGSGGLTLGVLLVTNIPILGIIGAPVVAALVLLIYTLGIDAFCRWSKDKDLRKADSENR